MSQRKQNLQKNVNILTTKYYNFFLYKTYCTRDGGSQNKFVYQPILYMLEIKIKQRYSWKAKKEYNAKPHYYILPFYIA